MKQKHLLLRFWFVIALVGVLCSSTAFGQPTLMHSYTFEDGTASDLVGSADGILYGDAIIEDGLLTISGTGFVSLPGKVIDLPSYSSFTVEAVFNQAADLYDVFAMMLAFGETNPDPDWMGINYWMFQPVRDDQMTRTAISCLNTTDPWATETMVNTVEINDDYLHYVTCMVDATQISMYIDGAFKGSADLSVDNQIVNMSNDTAYIGASVYPNDAKWRGDIDAVNIWEGTMDEATIKQRASELLGDAFFDATLGSLSSVPGTLDPIFDPGNDIYEVYVKYGTPYVVVDAQPEIPGATVEIYDGLGNLIPEDGVVYFTGNGVDLEIIVTALDGNTELSYYLSVFTYPVTEASTLSSINLSYGDLTTDFHPDSTDYIAIVPYGTTSLNVTGTKVWDGATVVGEGTVTITDGSATATLTVTSEDGNYTTEYTVDIFVSNIKEEQDYYILNESSSTDFDPGLVAGEEIDSYVYLFYPEKDEESQLFHFEQNGGDGQYFVKNKLGHYLVLLPDPDPSNEDDDWNLGMSETYTQNLDSCRFILKEFEPGRFKIQAVARLPLDHYDMGPNAINVGERLFSDKWADNEMATWNIMFPEDVVPPFDTYLDTLGIDVGPLSPEFVFFKTDYYITLPVGTASITLSAESRDVTATVTGAGTIDVPDEEGTITITVTATDPAYSTEYNIHYMKDTPLTLMHSYTFADGTGQDMVGDAHGDIQGGVITDGVFTSEVDGNYIILPSEDIELNAYPSITLETWVTPAENSGYAMLSYFGGLEGSNSLWIQIARGDDNARLEINSEGVTSINTLEPEPQTNHHYVGVITNDTMFFYVDGVLAGKSATGSTTMIRGIDPANGWLCDGGYAADPSWLGSMYEFNIYSGQMDPQTVAAHAINFPVEDATSNATLAALLVDGDTIDGFVPYQLTYELILPEGTTDIPVVTATAANPNASADVTDATELPGTATVLVTAEDGTTVNTYVVKISVVASDDATLSDLTVDGTTVDGFDPELEDYTVPLPAGTTVVPTVAATPNDDGAEAVVTPAASVPGITTVVVTAEDGETKKTYKVTFELTPAVENLNGFKVKVYPTVSSNGNFWVEISGGSGTISVYDITGQMVLQQNNEASKQIVTLPRSGMYIMKVDCEGASKTFKVFRTN